MTEPIGQYQLDPQERCKLHGDITVGGGLCHQCQRMDGNIRKIMLDLLEIKCRL